jgi:hypothetical protein
MNGNSCIQSVPDTLYGNFEVSLIKPFLQMPSGIFEEILKYGRDPQ